MQGQSTGRRADDGDVADDEIHAVMLAMRVLVAVTAQSVANLDERVTLPQLRVMVVVASQGPQNLATVAQGVRVHSPNATRACDKLVEAGLVARRDNPADRRNLVLELTPAGAELVESMNHARRAAVSGILGRMPVRSRSRLAVALEDFWTPRTRCRSTAGGPSASRRSRRSQAVLAVRPPKPR